MENNLFSNKSNKERKIYMQNTKLNHQLKKKNKNMLLKKIERKGVPKWTTISFYYIDFMDRVRVVFRCLSAPISDITLYIYMYVLYK